MRKDFLKLGRNSDKYIDFVSKKNSPFSNAIKKPRHLWDYFYYNGNPDLVTSKQFKRSLIKESRNGRKNNNYSGYDVECLIRKYDNFVEKNFFSNKKDDKEYFDKSMEYYYLETYKRIDFMYKLAVRMEKAGAGKIVDNEYLVKRFHPLVLVLFAYERNSLARTTNCRYYRPLIFVDDFYQKSYGDKLLSPDGKDAFENWYIPNLLRAKTYELFRFHHAFVSDNYEDITGFIRNKYNILGYFEPNKEWSSTEGKRIKNVLEIISYLFKDSDKRKPVEWQKDKK